MGKKILFVITKGNFGGAQRYVYDLATRLSREGYEVSVAFGERGILADLLEESDIQIYDVRSLSRDVGLFKDIGSFFELVRLMRSVGPDVVHLNSSKVGGLGALAARIVRVRRIVFTAHGWPFLERRNGIARGIIWILSWLTALFSHCVIVVSAHDYARGMRMPFAARKIHMIYNGVSPIPFSDEEALAGDGVRVLTIAELTANKNISTGIEAALRAREMGANIHYTVMGEGEERTALEAYVVLRDARDHVRLAGFVPNARAYLKEFDIFFLPSQKEGLPYVLLEAGLAGIPVIASRVGGIPEIVQTGESGLLCESQDVEGFAKALLELSKNEALRARFGEALQTRVQEKFSMEEMVRKTKALYE